MKYKVANVLGTEDNEVNQSRCGIFIYDENNNEYHINITDNGSLRITSHSGTISIFPQSMNQVLIKTEN